MCSFHKFQWGGLENMTKIWKTLDVFLAARYDMLIK